MMTYSSELVCRVAPDPRKCEELDGVTFYFSPTPDSDWPLSPKFCCAATTEPLLNKLLL